MPDSSGRPDLAQVGADRVSNLRTDTIGSGGSQTPAPDPGFGLLVARPGGGMQIVERWKASRSYAADEVVLHPTSGAAISRKTAGTSRSSFDATEEAQWTTIVAPGASSGGPGGGLTAEQVQAQIDGTPPQPLQILAKSASYTLALAEVPAIHNWTSSSAGTATIPKNSDVAIAIGQSVEFVQTGTGVLTVTAATGVTFPTGNLATSQNQSVLATKMATDNWLLSAGSGGDIPDATTSVKGKVTLGATGGAARHEAVLFKPTSTVVTNLGATRTLDVNVSNEKSLVGVLNTDLTLTLINFSIGSRADLWFTQGDPGGWDVTLAADGHGSQLLEGVNQAAGSENHIEIYFDGTNFRVDVN